VGSLLNDPGYSLIFQLVVAGLGSFAGAWAALRYEEDRARRDEIAAAKTARGLAVDIANVFLTLKKQHIRDLQWKYATTAYEFEIVSKGAKQGLLPDVSVVTFRADLRNLNEARTQIDTLVGVLTNRVTGVKPLLVVAPLHRCIGQFDDALRRRNELVKEYRALIWAADKNALYFGLPNLEGQDERWSQTVLGLAEYCDDCIYFAVLLDELLVEHLYSLGEPTRMTNFEKIKDFLPDPNEYPDYEEQYRPKYREIVM
jgi:hypothetical protein